MQCNLIISDIETMSICDEFNESIKDVQHHEKNDFQDKFSSIIINLYDALKFCLRWMLSGECPPVKVGRIKQMWIS